MPATSTPCGTPSPALAERSGNRAVAAVRSCDVTDAPPPPPSDPNAPDRGEATWQGVGPAVEPLSPSDAPPTPEPPPPPGAPLPPPPPGTTPPAPPTGGPAKGGKGKTLAIVAVVVLVGALAAFFLTKGGSDDNVAADSTTTTTEQADDETTTTSGDETTTTTAPPDANNPLGGITFVQVADDTGAITVEVPDSWVQVDGRPLNDGSPNVQASPDLNALRTSFDVSGVSFTLLAQPVDPDAGIDFITSNNGVAASCQAGERSDYSDGVFTGKFQEFSNCGGTGTSFVQIVASRADTGQGVEVSVQLVAADPIEIALHIAETFLTT